MSWYYINHRPNDFDHQKVYTFYKEDLEIVYPSGYQINCDEKLGGKNNDWYDLLRYLLIDGNIEILYPYYELHHENWKENLIKSGRFTNDLIIKPITMEDYENIYAPIIYYVRVPQKLMTLMVYSSYEEDLKTIYPGYEIYKCREDFTFKRYWTQKLPYTIEWDGIKEGHDNPSCLPNWKEELIEFYSAKGKHVRIYPFSARELFEDYESMAEEWRQSLDGKSVLQLLSESVHSNEIRNIQKTETGSQIDLNDDN